MAAQATNDGQNAVPVGFALPGPPMAANAGAQEVTGFALYSKPGPAYVNRVFDAIAGAPVTWVTFGVSDIADGNSYPGPGTFDPAQGGSDTSNHTVESIIDGNLL